MFAHLDHIYDPRERALVGLADLGLGVLTFAGRRLRRHVDRRAPGRILLLRLERIGDLLMTLGALASARATWPEARIDLVVGSWNRSVAERLPWVDRVVTFDAPWLARSDGPLSARAALAQVASWRRGRYDLAINFEGDIRSNVLIGLSGTPVRVGFPMAGGGAMLTHAVTFNRHAHTDGNTRGLVREAAAVFGTTMVEPQPRWPRFALPEAAEQAADDLLAGADVPGSGWTGTPDARRNATPQDKWKAAPGNASSLIGLHASGGRAIKQWPPGRFGESVGTLARATDARVVLTGAREDRALVDAARAALPPGIHVLDLSGRLDLLTLAAVLKRLTLYVTGDTGPMHLAAAMGTPVVAVFGVSDPTRYAPLVPQRRIVRIDLPCAPCNRVRLPPERCRGVVPDCLEGVGADMVARAGFSLLEEIRAGACA